MELEGSYLDKNFSYIQVRVRGCTESDLSKLDNFYKCKEDTDIAKGQTSLRVSLPEASINYGYDYTTDDTLEWSLNNKNSMQIDTN